MVKGLLPFEIQRQELLKELIHTERTHRKKLLIMKHVCVLIITGVHDVRHALLIIIVHVIC